MRSDSTWRRRQTVWPRAFGDARAWRAYPFARGIKRADGSTQQQKVCSKRTKENKSDSRALSKNTMGHEKHNKRQATLLLSVAGSSGLEEIKKEEKDREPMRFSPIGRNAMFLRLFRI